MSLDEMGSRGLALVSTVEILQNPDKHGVTQIKSEWLIKNKQGDNKYAGTYWQCKSVEDVCDGTATVKFTSSKKHCQKNTPLRNLQFFF